MAVSHVKSNIVADFTGTVTVLNSAGATTTVAATDLVRPTDWNSAHNQFVTISGNTAGQSTASGSNIVFGGTNVTLSLSTAANAATLNISGPPPAGVTLSEMWWPPTGQFQGNFNSVIGQGSFSLVPFTVPQYLSASEFDLFASASVALASNSSSAYIRHTLVGGVYSMANATRLDSVSTTTASATASWSSNLGAYQSMTGMKVLSFPWNLSLSPGVYWLGYGLSTSNNATNTSTATTALGHTLSMFGMMTRSSEMASVLFHAVDFGVQYGNANADNHARFFGYYSAATGAAPASIGSAQVSNTGTAPMRAGNIFRFRNI